MTAKSTATSAYLRRAAANTTTALRSDVEPEFGPQLLGRHRDSAALARAASILGVLDSLKDSIKQAEQRAEHHTRLREETGAAYATSAATLPGQERRVHQPDREPSLLRRMHRGMERSAHSIQPRNVQCRMESNATDHPPAGWLSVPDPLCRRVHQLRHGGRQDQARCPSAGPGTRPEQRASGMRCVQRPEGSNSRPRQGGTTTIAELIARQRRSQAPQQAAHANPHTGEGYPGVGTSAVSVCEKWSVRVGRFSGRTGEFALK